MEESEKIKVQKGELIQKQEFIVFGEDFARHAHSLEHLLRPLFLDNRFIWVETIGIRSPRISLYDFKRIAEKILSWLKPQKKSYAKKNIIPSNVHIVSPIMIPFNQFSLIRLFNKWSVHRAVKDKMRELSFEPSYFITSVPNACDYVELFQTKAKIYICVDEFSLWPGLDYKLVKRMEKELLGKVDLVFATSTALQQSKSNGRRPTLLLTHGVDFEHFNIGAKAQIGLPLKVCYFGLFDERSDQEILLNLVKEVPEIEIHIFGNVVVDISRLTPFKNIVFRGPVSYEDLPKSISEMDVFILPYIENELTRNINPLKLKEYLSTGRPVISTALPEVLKLSDYLFVAKNPAEFVAAIKELKKGLAKFDSQKVTNFICNNETWLSKSKQLCFELKSLPGEIHAGTSSLS